MAITTVTTGVGFVATLVAGVVLSRVLGPTGKGQLAQLVVWASFSVDLVLLGVPGAMTYSVAVWPEHRADLVRAIGRRLAIQAVVGAFLFALLATSRAGVHALPLLAIVSYAVWVPAATVFQWSSSYLQGRSHFVRFNSVRLVSESLPVIVLVVVAAVGLMTVSTAALIYAVAVSGAGLLGVIWTRRDAEDTGTVSSLETEELVGVLRMSRSFARREYVSTLAMKSNRSVDLLVLSLLAVSTSDIGFYSVATSSSGAIALVGFSVGLVAFSRSARERSNKKLLRSLVLWGGLLTGVAAAALYALAPTIVPLVYGDQFRPSVPLVRILVFGFGAVSLSQISAGILRGLGRPGSVAIAEAAGAFATVAGIILLGAAEIENVAYAAVAGFATTLIIEVIVLFPSRLLADPRAL